MGNVQTRERQASRLVGEEHRRKRNLQSSRTVKSNQVDLLFQNHDHPYFPETAFLEMICSFASVVDKSINYEPSCQHERSPSIDVPSSGIAQRFFFSFFQLSHLPHFLVKREPLFFFIIVPHAGWVWYSPVVFPFSAKCVLLHQPALDRQQYSNAALAYWDSREPSFFPRKIVLWDIWNW